jgi:protein SCO1/2
MYSDFRKWLWLTAVAALLGGIAVYWAISKQGASQGPDYQQLQASMDIARVYPSPRPLSPFTLSEGPDAPFSLASLQGQWHWVFFGFTNCPDICPMTLHELGVVEKMLAEQAPELPVPQTLFVSVDPERDDREKIASYTEFFGERILGATGNDEELMRLGRQLGAIYVDVEGEEFPDGYTVDHTGSVFLINPDAELVANFPLPHRAEGLLSDYRRLIQAGNGEWQP